MPKENTIYELLNVLRGKHDVTLATQEIEVLSYFAYKTITYQVNYSEVDFSDRSTFNSQILEISDNCDTKTATLLKDIIVTGVLHCCEELNAVYSMLLKFTKEEIVEMLLDLSPVNGMHAPWYTDDQICDLFVELTKDFKTNNILDICSGKGNLLLKYSQNHKDVHASGIEMNELASLISKLKLDMINAEFEVRTDNVLSMKMNNQFDLVYCHYPWGMRSKEDIAEDELAKLDYSNINRNRLDWAFIIKALNSINEHGKAFVLAPAGALFNSTDKENRKNLVENGYLETVIALPSGALSTTNVSFNLLILSNDNEQVKFIDATNLFEKQAWRKDIQIDKVVELVASSENELIKFVDFDEIASKDFDLSINMYINSVSEIEMINPVPIKELAEVITGFQYTSKSLTELNPKEGNASIVKITNIEQGEIDYENLAGADLELEKVEKYILRENDILVSNKGAKPKIVLLKDLEDKILIPQSNLTIIRTTSNEILALYLYAFLSSDTGINLLKSLMKGSVVISNISRKDLMEMSIPVLEKEDQELICTRYTILSKKLAELNVEIQKVKSKLATIYTDKVGE